MRKTRHILIALTLMLALPTTWAQTTPVTVGNTIQTVNGKEYYVHVVQPGQTVFSIARAYGLHYSAAVLRTDIQSMSVGDTVWLPVNEQSHAAVKAAYRKNDNTIAVREVVVEPKQTLYSIARLYNTTIETIEKLNPDVKTYGLKAGQTIKVPAASANEHLSNATPNNTTTNTTYKPANAANTSTAIAQSNNTGGSPAVIRDRISPNKIHVTVMMPLYLDKATEISTTKFDVEQRGKKSYKSFDFIQFYEGILMGLQELERRGCHVVLNVVDIPNEDDATVVNAFNSHNIANSDFIIALLTRNPFKKAAELAKENQVFIISPMSERDAILADNPYVVKYTPSDKAIAKSMISIASKNYPGSHIYLIHSKNKNEAAQLAEFEQQLKERNDIKYTVFNWSNVGKLVSTLKSTHNNVVVNLYDQGRDKNRIQTNLLLNRMMSVNPKPVLMTTCNYVRDFSDIDYAQLQNVNYHMPYTAYLDYNNPTHKLFIDNYKNRFKTEPLGPYAGIANDIIIYFVSGLSQKGTNFWRSPSIPRPNGMLFPLVIQQTTPTSGFENQAAIIYKMQNYQLIEAK